MDFTYYQKVGLFSDAMLQQLARYQRSGVHLLEESNTAMQEYLDLLSSISNIVGSVNYCKLNVSEVSDSDGYIQLM